MSKTLVIIPTYNEKENIEAIIRAVFSLTMVVDILVVDDNSPDDTANIVRILQKDFQCLHLAVRTTKKGLGNSYIHGFKWALQKEYEYIIEMDADFSHNPKDLVRLHTACAEHGNDFSIGSRYINNKINVVNWDFKRLLLSYLASKYVKIITGIPIFDTTAGFVCYHHSVLRDIDLSKIQFTGYAFQIEMKFKAWKKKFKHKEVSIIFEDRKLGVSKMNSSIIFEAIYGVLKLQFGQLFKKN